MRRLLSFCLVLCVSLSLLTVFSVTANAEEIRDYTIRQDVYVYYSKRNPNKPSDEIYENFFSFTPNNGTEESYEELIETGATGKIAGFYEIQLKTVWNVFAPPNGYPFKLNKVNRVVMENFYFRYLVQAKSVYYVNDYVDLYALITYTDGTTERVECVSEIDSDMALDISFEFKPTQNVERFDIYVISNTWEGLVLGDTGKDQNTKVKLTAYYGEIKGDNKHNFNIEIQSEEATLLSGILGWIQNIWNKMTDTFDKLTDIGSYILELPSKLWNLISEGLQYLFIPTEEAITEFKSKMDTLLENKLGAVYQVSNTVIEAWDRIQESDETDTIEFPSTTINLPGGNEFTFGGYDVKIVPDGFTIVVTALKSIVGIVCTIAFVNGLRKRYDEVMGVVQ